MFKKIDECAFRELYHHLLLLTDDDRCIMAASMSFPHEDGDNALLLYGYVDPEMGMSFEVLCMANYIEGQSFSVRQAPKEKIMKLRYDAISGRLVTVGNVELHVRFLPRMMEINQNYRASDEIEQFREMWFLDELRHPAFPDDICVYMATGKADDKPEGIWSRLAGFDGHYITVKLLNEPYKDYGYHRGDTVQIKFLASDDHILAHVTAAQSGSYGK